MDNCSSIAGLIALAADGELQPDEQLLLSSHLAQCPSCHAQAALFDRTDRRLLECRAILDTVSPPSANRPLPQPTRSLWRWAPAAVAALTLALVATRTTLRERPAEPPRATSEFSDNAATVVPMELPLSPVGDPFLDSSPAESVIRVDVAIGADGQPKDIHLAN
jgi:anti-sigma factor RsiW